MTRSATHDRFPRTQALLKAAMDARGYTFTNLAVAPGVEVSRQMVGQWVAGVQPVAWPRLEAVATALRIDTGTLMAALAQDMMAHPVRDRAHTKQATKPLRKRKPR